MLRALNAEPGKLFHLTDSGRCKRITIYIRLPRNSIKSLEKYSAHKYTLRQLKLPRAELLLAAAHLSGKPYYEETDKDSECRIFATAIREAEEGVGHTRTLLVGDLNANPFADGVVKADGLHGVMSRAVATRGRRRVAAKSYPFFYNPMWGRFGESTEGPAGTFYYPGSTYKEFFWHMTDQVLLRPALMASFKNEDLKVLTVDGDRSLLTRNGFPDAKFASDHLPILFRLDI
jgi:endonuclease/exonuclease/phosphatase family metal-dependent hydrolase